MNIYKVQIKNITNGKLDRLHIYANSIGEAFEKANNYMYPTILPLDDGEPYSKDYRRKIYKDYKIISLSLTESDCDILQNHDTISILNTEEDNDMAFFNVNWKDYKDALLKISTPETWSNETYPNNEMLVNYMVHTVKKLKSEKSIIQTKEYGLFNTGLFTTFYEPIFAYATSEFPVSFMTPYELGNIGIDEYPERANYFEDPSLLLFDWHYKINIHYKHILDDIKNIKRLPEKIQNNKNILNNLNGSIDTMKKRFLLIINLQFRNILTIRYNYCYHYVYSLMMFQI